MSEALHEEQSHPKDVIAGIVTFNPDIERLTENVDAIRHQVDHLVIVDNGSANVDEIRALLPARERVELVEKKSNVGIAAALNALVLLATERGYRYIVTLDQDSVASPSMVSVLRGTMAPGVGLVTPLIVDRNKQAPESPPADVQYYRFPAQKGAITSGSLLSLDAANQVGGFDDELFIDYVDYDLNARLLLAGYKIARSNRATLLHEVGQAARTWLFTPRRDLEGRWTLERFYAFGHSPLRCYYKARNRVIFTKKYGMRFGLANEGVWQIPQQIALTCLFETDRRRKLAAFLRGIRDGLRYKVPETPSSEIGAGLVR